MKINNSKELANLDDLTELSDRSSFDAKMMNPKQYAGLDAFIQGPVEELPGIVKRGVEEGVPIEGIEHQMKSEVLHAYAAGADADVEAALIAKYSKYAHDTFDVERGEFRIKPLAEISPAWERVSNWARRLVESGAIFIHEGDDGRTNIVIRQNLSGFQAALTMLGIQLRFDSRSQLVQLGLSDGSWVILNDFREAALRCLIEEKFSFVKSMKGGLKATPAEFLAHRWKRCKEAHLSTNSVDCFEIWLGSLPVWDGKPRLDTWLVDAGMVFDETTEPELCRWICRSIPLVAAKRTIDPGLKHDVMPVLISKQGLGKSTCMAHLLPPDERSRWFKDELRLSADSKERVESILGAVIVEVAEMTGATNADIESLKAFLSRETDNVRLAYRVNAEPLPRGCSIVGTANRNMLPNDPTGNRRFAAAFLTGGSPVKARAWLDANRVQLWAETWKRAKDGEEVYIDAKLADIQAAANETARSADTILENAAGKWLSEEGRGKVPGRHGSCFHMVDAAVGCGMIKDSGKSGELKLPEQRRLGRALRQLGCESVRRMVDGVQTRMWTFPE